MTQQRPSVLVTRRLPEVIETRMSTLFDARFNATDAQLDGDAVIVLRFQGPRANGMPEVHGLTPTLSVLQDRGHKIALLTDGRMSGASGKIPAAIHLSPEAMTAGPLARVRDGDPIRLNAEAGSLMNLAPDFDTRAPATADLSTNHTGSGRELFALFRAHAAPATAGASPLFPEDAS